MPAGSFVDSVMRRMSEAMYGPRPEQIEKPAPAPSMTMAGASMPDMSNQLWKTLAGQTRPLTPTEKSVIRQTFDKSLNPDNFRLGYDDGANGTNLEGWVQPTDNPLPGITYLSTFFRRPIHPSLTHESTHIWQNLLGKRYTGHSIENILAGYDYKSMAGWPFEKLGAEQQAAAVGDNDPAALAFIRSHPAPDNPNAGLAFLDSVRSAYPVSTHLPFRDPDAAARLGAVDGISAIQWTKRGIVSNPNPFLLKP
jgi:hypothetical protein